MAERHLTIGATVVPTLRPVNRSPHDRLVLSNAVVSRGSCLTVKDDYLQELIEGKPLTLAR
jgi:hypothetical protein